MERDELSEFLYRLGKDPDAVREEMFADLVKEKGQEWVDANRHWLYTQWYFITRDFMGFRPTRWDD